MPAPVLSDLELLRKLDNHGESLDSYGCDMLESMMKQVEDKKRPLTEVQRAWALRMIDQLDTRRSHKHHDEED